jgi:Na+-transporting NADH:ubiquinone oxidoreductase subunit NqrB
MMGNYTSTALQDTLRETGENKLSIFQWFRSDARHYQIFFLLSFLMYGIFMLEWDAEWEKILAIFGTCMVTQLIGAGITGKEFSSVKSALISALSLCLMLRANSEITLMLASVLSIAGKFIIRFQGKHIFNPTNFGIMVTILVTGDAWISPGQWGSNGILFFLIGAAGLVVLLSVKRLDTAIAFFGTFVILNFIRSIVYLGWPIDFFIHQFTSGTLLLFTFFMITDPVSSPNHRIARIIWACMIGALAFILSSKFFIHGAPIWALFFLSPLTVILDKMFKYQLFKWKNSKS